MSNSTTSKIQKLDDISLENISGGAVNLKGYVQTTGAIATTIGLLGSGVCVIASSCCKNKNAKVAERLTKAGMIFTGVAALGGSAFVGSELLPKRSI